jgi:hypothetical protein
MKDLYNNTKEISNKLIETWECDFKKDIEIKNFEKNWNGEAITPLNPRDAFMADAIILMFVVYIQLCNFMMNIQ